MSQALPITPPPSNEPFAVAYSAPKSYAVGSFVSLEPKMTAYIRQNGLFVAKVMSSLSYGAAYTLDKKQRFLKKGLFDKEYKGISVMWFHWIDLIIPVDSSVQVGYEHKPYKFRIKCSFSDFSNSAVEEMVKSTKIELDRDKPIYSISLVRDIISDHVRKGVIEYLQKSRADRFVPTGVIPPEIQALVKRVTEGIAKIGPSGSISILPY